MATEQHIALALRKERLLVQVQAQRETLAQWGGRLRKPCALADKTLDAGRYVKAHPWTAGAAAGVAALVGRRHLLRVARYAWRGWRAWRFVSGLARESDFIKSFKNK
jgi:ElaB/YqjD/DUF883 family membrane-anchored ribosome-binding protein